jgi:transposase
VVSIPTSTLTSLQHLDPLGRLVGTESFDADAAGYKALFAWLEEFGQVAKVGVEGTGSYGVGLARFLRRKGIDVVEVNRPNRQARRNQGKSDPIDAIEAARAAISGRASGLGKTKDGPVEAIRVLVVAKRSARQARVKAIVQMRNLGVSAPDQLHSRLKGLTITVLVNEAAKFRCSRSADPVTAATKAALSSLAHRVQVLDSELVELDEKIEALLLATAPELMGLFGVGTDTAASLLVATGDNPDRLHSEAAWAHLCGASPIPADSGKNSGRHRRHEGGDRQANSALWRIAMVRIAHDPETTAYFNRRVKEGRRTKRDVIRILQRYIAREVYRYLPRG